MTDMHATPSAAEARPLGPARLRPALWTAAVVVPGVAAGAQVLAFAVGLPAGAPLVSLLAGVLLAAAVVGGLWQAGPQAHFAPCSRVTFGRAGLVAVLAGLVAAPAMLAVPPLAWAAVVLAGTALVLDGVDGWMARRSGQATPFGARFDMEVDAALALVLAVLVAASGKVGVWVLALGVMRYAFGAAATIWPWLSAPLPESLRRKTVCVVQVVVLTTLLAPVVPPWLAAWLAAGALAALLVSFARDVLWLWHHRRPQGIVE